MRQIDELTENIYRCRHHDFQCLTVAETSEALGVSEDVVQRRLAELEATNPGLFPILTKKQKTVRDLYLDGCCVEMIETYFSISQQAVYRIIQYLISVGELPKPAKNVVLLEFIEETMSHLVKEKF